MVVSERVLREEMSDGRDARHARRLLDAHFRLFLRLRDGFIVRRVVGHVDGDEPDGRWRD